MNVQNGYAIIKMKISRKTKEKIKIKNFKVYYNKK